MTPSDQISLHAVVDCGLPKSSEFPGNVSFLGTTFGSVATFVCPGDCNQAMSFCQENGKWTDVIPECNGKD